MSRAWMPLYIGDYLADTSHLSVAQHGCYLLLIMHYWQNGNIPDDDRILARICRCEPEHWTRYYKNVVLNFFKAGGEAGGSAYRHGRIDAELARYAEISNKRKAAALQMHGRRDANASVLHMHLHTQSQSPERDSSESLSPRSPRSRAKPRATLPDDFNPVVKLEEATELEHFKDHARATGRLCADWNAAWRNWLRSPYRKPNGTAHGRGRQVETIEERGKRLYDACVEREQEVSSGLFRKTDHG
jgi:uncharacterized protein YdaU (DUF1376 family)